MSTLASTTDGLLAPGFKILGELGRGGMGAVYKAWQVRLKRLVALKIIRADAYLYEMLTGRPPFKGTTPLSTMEQVSNIEPLSPGKLQRHTPRDLEIICLRCPAEVGADRSARDDAENGNGWTGTDIERLLGG